MDTINGIKLKAMLRNGSNNLNNYKNEIDALNVFPVPDGDTGTNMSMTFSSGTKDAIELASDELSLVAKALSKGLLMGARGNSGVILSQIFRGFYQELEGKKEATVSDLASAFLNGSIVSYKAVMRPVEGTILTVIRESSEMAKIHLENNPDISINEYMDVLCMEAKKTLDYTPELLPILKEVGVVDSGGAGLLKVLEGFKAALLGEVIETDNSINDVVKSNIENTSGEFGYCTEFIVRLNHESLNTFKEDRLRLSLSKLGDSIVVVKDDDIVKVHVHTLTPGNALNIAQRYGEFVKLKIENMQEQHNEIILNEKVKEVKKYAIVAVAAGSGLESLFKEYRTDKIISGGQTMNPSTEDFVEVIKELDAEHIFVLPNNSNIILAAQQAQQVLENDNIHVLPSKSIPEGISACLVFNPEVDIESNIVDMQEAIEHTKTGQITYAIKNTTFDGNEIAEGDYMGIYEKEIVSNSKDKDKVTKDLINRMVDEESEIITVYVGAGVNKDEVDAVEAYINDNFDIEVEIQNGDQPVYSFVFGVE
ncbi:MAG: DAK2 domain-containing protein [Anaerorhabdus sp.]